MARSCSSCFLTSLNQNLYAFGSDVFSSAKAAPLGTEIGKCKCC